MRAGAARTDWRDGLSTAADLALIGIAVTVAAAPVVTAGAAVRTGSVAVRRLVEGERVPPADELWRVFRRSLLPGLAAAVVVLAVAGLLLVDLVALSSGRVPGGPAAVALTGCVAAVFAAVAGLTVARLGRDGDEAGRLGSESGRDGSASDHSGGGWLAAVRWAGATTRRRPAVAAAVAGVMVLGATLAVLVPATAPLAVGFTLYAIHVVARRA